MAGNILWSNFSRCLTGAAGTFTANARLMGKVYLPRPCVPISTVLSKQIRFGIQAALFFLLRGCPEKRGRECPGNRIGHTCIKYASVIRKELTACPPIGTRIKEFYPRTDIRRMARLDILYRQEQERWWMNFSGAAQCGSR